nr:glycoprotein vIgFam1 [Elephant endotheliotropic herpesvirus 1A]
MGGGFTYLYTIYLLFIPISTSEHRSLNKHVFVKTVNLGGNIVFGPIPTDKYREIKWFYNQDQIIYWNETKTLYTNTNAKLLTSFPFRLNISNAQISDAGNYTLYIQGCNGKTDNYPFRLIVNYTLYDSPTLLPQVSSSSSLLSYDYIVFVVVSLVFIA